MGVYSLALIRYCFDAETSFCCSAVQAAGAEFQRRQFQKRSAMEEFSCPSECEEAEGKDGKCSTGREKSRCVIA